MKTTTLAIVAAALTAGLANTSQSAGPPKQDELRSIVQRHLSALDSKDLEKALSVVHSESKEYKSLKSGQPSMFAHFTYKHELSSFRFVGSDATYAYLSFKQKKTKLDGPDTPYDNTLSDVLVAFRQEADRWKIWRTCLLNWAVLGGKPKTPARTGPVPRTKSDTPPNCLYHLRLIDSAKEQYAMSHSRKKGDSVSADQISRYIKGGYDSRVCPAGGTYTINAIGMNPECSIEGHALK